MKAVLLAIATWLAIGVGVAVTPFLFIDLPDHLLWVCFLWGFLCGFVGTVIAYAVWETHS